MSSNSSGSGSPGPSKTLYVYHERMIIVAYLGAIVIPIAVVMNLLMILAFIVYKKLRITGMYFIVNLALNNLVATIISAPIIISSLISDTQSDDIEWLTKGFPCDIRAFLDNMLLCASAVTLAVSSVDRCLAVCKPFKYHKLITHRRAVLIIAVIWVTCFLISIPPLNMQSIVAPLRCMQWGSYSFSRYTYSCGVSLDGGYPMFYFVMTLFIPVTVAIISYSVIFSAAAKSNKTLVKTYKSVTPADRTRSHRTMRSAFRTLALVGVFAITFLPILVVSCVMWVQHANGIPKIHMSVTVTKVLVWVVYSNYALNPLVYGLMDRNFRGAFKSITRCKLYHDTFRHRAQKQLYNDLEEDRRRSVASGSCRPSISVPVFKNWGSSDKFLTQSIPLTEIRSNGISPKTTHQKPYSPLIR